MDPREVTEEAALTGRFPDDDGTLRDDSAPVEEAVPAGEVDEDDGMRPNEAVPLRDDLPGVVVTPPAEQRRSPGSHQPTEGLDPGVDREHLEHGSQGVRPEER